MHSKIRAGLACLLAFGLAGLALAQDPAREPSPPPAASNRILDSVDVESLKAELDGKSAEQIRQLLPGIVGDAGGSLTNSLGQPGSDLVFVPIAPCRVIDTRVAGGAFAAGESRSYHIVGSTNYSAYGGNAAGCGIPAGNVRNPIDVSGLFILSYTQKVRALALNFVAVTPSGSGNLRAWPTNQTVPTAATMNFSTAMPALANGVIVTSCDAYDMIAPFDPCPSGDVTIRADASPTHVVVDVQGYFTPATGYGERASAASDTNVVLATTCTNLLSVTVANDSAYDRTVVCTASANIDADHTSGTADILVLKIADAATTCPGSPIGEAGESLYNVPSGLPSGFYYDTPGLLQTFEIDADTSATYYLNGQTRGGSGANTSVGHSLTCFIP